MLFVCCFPFNFRGFFVLVLVVVLAMAPLGPLRKCLCSVVLSTSSSHLRSHTPSCVYHGTRYQVSVLRGGGQYFMVNNCDKKILETLYTIRFADFFPPAIAPIPVRTRKINPQILIFNNCSGGNHPVSYSIVKRSYRYSVDFGRDSPAIC
jgi:hypothetical protein